MAKEYVIIDTTKLMSDIAKAEADIARAEKETAEMFAAVTELNKMWKGPANDAFNQEFNSDYKLMKDYLSSLKKFTQKLRDDKKAYESCETQVLGKTDSLKI